MEDILSDLNPRQREAVLRINGPLLIQAGAGSGKTRVITHKIAYLIRENGIDASQIIALTFTNKAAEEMRERVRDLLGRSFLNIWISTFHSACARILRSDIERLGYRKDFVIYDTTDSLHLIKECMKSLDINEELYSSRDILDKISEKKRNLIMPGDSSKEGFGFLHCAERVYPLYQKALYHNHALDFDDLLLVTIRLFQENPDILEAYQKRFRYILVDEYQDTNHSQYVLLNLLSKRHKNICVVGDDDQSIYHWRGANLKNILDFEKDYPDTHTVTLEENYRSTKTILDAAAEVVRKNEKRKEKRLWTNNGEGDKIVYFRAEDERGEADYIAGTIKGLCSNGEKRFKDIAVFYRTNAQSRVLEDSLRRNRISYRIIKGLKFYERKEIKDILAYMKVILNPHDSLCLKRIINVPARGIGKGTCDKLETYRGERNLSFFQAIEEVIKKDILAPAVKKRLEDFLRLIKKFIKLKDEESASQIVKEVLTRTRLTQMIEKGERDERDGRLENIKEFVSAVEEFERREEEKSLRSFLDYTALITQEDIVEEDTGAVSLMTLHSSKGLEFPVVFISGMENGLFPHEKSFETMEELEEERRLCYVGMTRAKSNLFLTNSVQRNIYGQYQRNFPSMFLQDIPSQYIIVSSPPSPEEKRGLSEGKKVHHPKFGLGIVRASEGQGDSLKLTISFQKFGKKKLVAKYASLKEI